MSKGEKYSFSMELNVPESVEPGSYTGEVIVKCDEGEARTNLNVATYRNNFEVKILDYERDGNELSVTYSLEEFAREEHKILISYALKDFDGVERTKGQVEVALGAGESTTDVLKFVLPKDSFGEFTLEMKLGDGISEISTSKEIFLPSSSTGLTGFIISEDNRRNLSYFGAAILILAVLVFAVVMVRRFKRSVKKAEVLKSDHFDKKKYNRFVEVQL